MLKYRTHEGRYYGHYPLKYKKHEQTVARRDIFSNRTSSVLTQLDLTIQALLFIMGHILGGRVTVTDGEMQVIYITIMNI
jgi:hypothetical protein